MRGLFRVLSLALPWGCSMTWGRPEIVSKKEVGSARCFHELAPQQGNQCAEDGRRSMNTRSLSSSDWGLMG